MSSSELATASMLLMIWSTLMKVPADKHIDIVDVVDIIDVVDIVDMLTCSAHTGAAVHQQRPPGGCGLAGRGS